MWTDGWTDSSEEPYIHFSEIYEAHDIVLFILLLNSHKTRAYLGLTGRRSAGE